MAHSHRKIAQHDVLISLGCTSYLHDSHNTNGPCKESACLQPFTSRAHIPSNLLLLLQTAPNMTSNDPNPTQPNAPPSAKRLRQAQPNAPPAPNPTLLRPTHQHMPLHSRAKCHRMALQRAQVQQHHGAAVSKGRHRHQPHHLPRRARHLPGTKLRLVAHKVHMRGLPHKEGVPVAEGVAGECVRGSGRHVLPLQRVLHHVQPGAATAGVGDSKGGSVSALTWCTVQWRVVERQAPPTGRVS
jgi:hypothetical protein